MNETDAVTAFRAAAPELLGHLADVTREILVKLTRMDTDIAEQVAVEIANRMARHWGGQLVYIPAGAAIRISQRDEAIWRDFNGNNHDELAHQYGISLQWVYQIVKKMRQRDMETRQASLLD